MTLNSGETMDQPSLSEESLTKVAQEKQVSKGELEALKLALLKKSKSKEIAAELDISEAAARKRLGEVYRKFDIKGRGPGKLASLKEKLLNVKDRGDRPLQSIDESASHIQLDDAPTISHFIGREAPLAQLSRWILSPAKTHRLLAICGIGGIGKSYLARRLIDKVGGQFESIVWLSTKSKQTPEAQLLSLLNRLQASSSKLDRDELDRDELDRDELDRDEPDEIDTAATSPSQIEGDRAISDTNALIEEVVDQLCSRRCLIVLDGFERLFVSHRNRSIEPLDSTEDGDSDISIEKTVANLSNWKLDANKLDADTSDADTLYTETLNADTLNANALGSGVLAAKSIESANGESTKDPQTSVFYKPGFEIYSQLFKAVKLAPAQSQKRASCLIVTSREKPRELLAQCETVKLYTLDGLNDAEAEALLNSFNLKDSTGRSALIERYCGHPMALRFAANTIKEVFFGSTQDFLDQEISVFYDIRSILRTQFKRLSIAEKEAMYWLAINHIPCQLEEIRADIVSAKHKKHLPHTLRSLEQRSLVEIKHSDKHSENLLFELHPIVAEYVLDRLIRKVCSELRKGDLDIFNSHALMKADAEEIVRVFQQKAIIRPIIERLSKSYQSLQQVDERISELLNQYRADRPHYRGYAGGNFVNLLLQISEGKLTCKDFSQMTIWQAYLQGAQLRQVSFNHCRLDRSVFTETLGDVTTTALSDSKATEGLESSLLAVGDTQGAVHLWHTQKILSASGQKFCEWIAHSGWVRAIALVPRQSMPLSVPLVPLLVTAGDDKWLKLWRLPTKAQPLPLPEQVWQQIGNDRIYAIALSPRGDLIAAGGDSTVALYETQTGRQLYPLAASELAIAGMEAPSTSSATDSLIALPRQIRAIAFSPNGQWIAAESDGHTIQLLPVDALLNRSAGAEAIPLSSLAGHTSVIHALAFSPDGRQLVSAGEDQKICIWDMETRRLQKTLYRATDSIRAVAISPDNRLLASAGNDCQITLWDLHAYQLLKEIPVRQSRVSSVGFQQQGDKLLLVAGSDRQRLRLWQITSGERPDTVSAASTDRPSAQTESEPRQHSHSLKVKPLKTYQGYTNGIRAVAFLGENSIISGGDSCDLSVWDRRSCQRKASLSLHHGRIWAIAVDRQNKRIASASDDHTVRLWDAATGKCLITLPGHRNWVRTVAFSRHGQFLASAGDDCTIRIWNTGSGYCLKTLEQTAADKRYWIRSVAFDPQNARYLVSGGDSQVVERWDRKEGTCKPLASHTQRIYSVAYSPDGKLIASGSADATVKLWDTEAGNVRHHLKNADMAIQTVAFSPDGRYLAAGGEDQVVYVWSLDDKTLEDKNIEDKNLEESCFVFMPRDSSDLSGGIRSIAFSPDGKFLISGGLDEIIRISDLEQIEVGRKTGEPGILGLMVQRDRPYENIEIEDIKGLSSLQKASLMTLGAVDNKQSLLL